MSEVSPNCERCNKPSAICVCDRVVPLETALRILVLQHPQEDDAVLGTVPLLALSLPSATVRVGLSWSSLEAVADALPALGAPTEHRAQLRRLMRTMVQRARDARVQERSETASDEQP
jgi:DTW domain-containing protein YfiP